MKNRLLFLFTLLFAASFAIADQVPRDKVVIEIGTATW